MRGVAAVLVAGLAAFGARAQSPPPRQIDPEHFHPFSQGELSGRGSAAPIVMPTKERPFGACDPRTHDWIVCLAATAARSDRIVDEAEQSVRAVIENRRELSPYLRNARGEALARIDTDWRKFRDAECDALAMLERGLPAQVYEARLTCRILRNLERGEAMKARYGGG